MIVKLYLTVSNCTFSIIIDNRQIRFFMALSYKQPNLQRCFTVSQGHQREWMSSVIEIFVYDSTNTLTHWVLRQSRLFEAMKHFYTTKELQRSQKMCKNDRNACLISRVLARCVSKSLYRAGDKILIGTSLKWIEHTEDKLLNLAIKAMWFTVNSTRLTVPQLRA